MAPLRRRSPAALAVAAAAVALLWLGPAGAAHAHEPYTDDDANYLKIIDYFAYPIGVLLEWTVARPLHALETRGAQGARQGRVQRVGTLRIKRGCAAARPPRYCTGKRYQY